MSFNLWFIYLGIFAAFSFVGLISDSQLNVGASSDINNAITFEVDQISSGSGFLALMRSSVSFTTETLPKVTTFNYSFLQGDLQIVRQLLMMMFGGTLTIMIATSMTGLLRRNVG